MMPLFLAELINGIHIGQAALSLAFGIAIAILLASRQHG